MTNRIDGKELQKELRGLCFLAGSQKAWAEANGLSSVHVSEVLGGKRTPGPKLLAAMGYRRVVLYEGG